MKIIKEKKYSMTFTKEELIHLAGIMYHFTDYMAHDDRLDHGLARLKYYREEMPTDDKGKIYTLAGKLKRRVRNLK